MARSRQLAFAGKFTPERIKLRLQIALLVSKLLLHMIGGMRAQCRLIHLNAPDQALLTKAQERTVPVLRP